MGIENVLQLIGGLALFLYGMQLTSTGMEEAAGDKMKTILEKLTSNRWIALLVGAGITMLVQSSSATTVMVVGFVNSGMMTLRQAVWIIMGANIGTTVTGQLIALDVSMLAPVLAMVGVIILMFIKKPKLRPFGAILTGLGVLFIGMDMMSGAMEPLRDSPQFIEIVQNFRNPLVGILVGAGFTAIIQSSAASIGIMQALAVNGVVSLDTAVYVLFGQNIGTCVTALLASIGAKRNAKRTTIIHLLFNIIGTVVFTLICMFTPLTDFVASLTPTRPATQIANMHTIFNVATSLMLLPFDKVLVKIAMIILPEKPHEKTEAMHLKYLQPLLGRQQRRLGSSEIYLAELQNELLRMLAMARNNLIDGFNTLLEKDTDKIDEVHYSTDYVHYLNKEISKSISNFLPFETNPANMKRIASYITICANVERIADHSLNIAEYSLREKEENINFNEDTIEEIFAMKNICIEILSVFFEGMDTKHQKLSVQKMEDIIKEMTREYRDGLVKRMQSGELSQASSLLYSEILVDFERIGDHALNIASELRSNRIEYQVLDEVQEKLAVS